MGDVPINPTGFAHGFRPLDGDHPPPTPTQQSAVPTGFSTAGFLSQISQRSSQGGMGGGLGCPRKRRRLPGPLAFFQQGGSGAAGGSGQDGGESDNDNDESLSGRGQTKGEAGGGHFRKGAWLSLCSAIDTPIPDEGSSDARAAQTFLKGALSPISEVLAGDFDLRVPVVTAVIDSYNKLSHSDVVVELVDPSGRMKGYLHPGCLEEHGPNLGPGAAILLKEVSIFVSGPGTTRLLNVHPACVLAVFPADTPLPTPARLDWLRTCDPPFTPRPVPDCGSNSGQPEEHLTSSPTTSTSKTPRGGGSGRRRARPVSRDELHRSQQRAPPRPPPQRRPQQSQLAELRTGRGGSGGLGHSASSAINPSVLGDSQGACRREHDNEEEEEEEDEEEEEEEEGEEDRVLERAAFAGTDGAAASLQHEDADGAPSSPPSFSPPERTQPSPNAQPLLRPAPDDPLTPLYPRSTPLANSQSQLDHTSVSGEGGNEGGGGTAPLRDTSRGTIREARAIRTCGSTREGCEGSEGKNSSTTRATKNSWEKTGRPVYPNCPEFGSSGSAFLDRPVDRSESRVNLLESPPPASTLDSARPQNRARGTGQREGSAAESAEFLATALGTRLSQAADIAEPIVTVDAGPSATARTILGEEEGGSKDEPAGLGVERIDGREGVAGQARVSSSMWSDLDDLDSDDSDEESSTLLPGRDSSIGGAIMASGQPQHDAPQGSDGGSEAVLAKQASRSQDSDLRETGVGGRGTTAPSRVERDRETLVGDVRSSNSNTAIPMAGSLARMPPSNAAPGRHTTASSGQALSGQADVSTGEALSQNLGGTPVAALSGASTVAARRGVFSLLGGEGGFENDDLLDAALDDSDQE